METVEPTSHPKISKNKNEIVQEDILEKVEVFRELIKEPDKGKIVRALQVIVPAFTPDL